MDDVKCFGPETSGRENLEYIGVFWDNIKIGLTEAGMRIWTGFRCLRI
jgi:hypothetical protein